MSVSVSQHQVWVGGYAEAPEPVGARWYSELEVPDVMTETIEGRGHEVPTSVLTSSEFRGGPDSLVFSEVEVDHGWTNGAPCLSLLPAESASMIVLYAFALRKKAQ
ncbi:MAG: hypothetical protein AAF645_19090, partial [Myxococcota bacterium]